MESQHGEHGGQTEYLDLGKIHEPENSKNSLNFLHLNISLIPFHFSELRTTKVNFNTLFILIFALLLKKIHLHAKISTEFPLKKAMHEI